MPVICHVTASQYAVYKMLICRFVADARKGN
jgi:hypothetical protein